MAFPSETESFVAALEHQATTDRRTFMHLNGDPNAAGGKANGVGVGQARQAIATLRAFEQRLNKIV